jgi:hypothetical protein
VRATIPGAAFAGDKECPGLARFGKALLIWAEYPVVKPLSPGHALPVQLGLSRKLAVYVIVTYAEHISGLQADFENRPQKF